MYLNSAFSNSPSIGVRFDFSVKGSALNPASKKVMETERIFSVGNLFGLSCHDHPRSFFDLDQSSIGCSDIASRADEATHRFARCLKDALPQAPMVQSFAVRHDCAIQVQNARHDDP